MTKETGRILFITILIFAFSFGLAWYVLENASKIHLPDSTSGVGNIDKTQLTDPTRSVDTETQLEPSIKNEQKKENVSSLHLLIFSGIGILLFAVFSNLLSHIIVCGCEREQKTKLTASFESIDEIKKNVINKCPIVLHVPKRKSVYSTKFYNDLYNEATEIKISGKKTTEIIANIVKYPKEKDNWVKQLESREGVSIRIITTNPNSKSVTAWEKRELLQENSLKKEMQNNFELLKDFANKNEIKLAKGSSITIRVVSDVQCFNITYAGIKGGRENSRLFLSISFNRDAGPLYEIKQIENTNTFDECLEYFDRVYDVAKPIFHWDDTKPVFYDWQQKANIKSKRLQKRSKS